jgi:hypothetical protein
MNLQTLQDNIYFEGVTILSNRWSTIAPSGFIFGERQSPIFDFHSSCSDDNNKKRVENPLKRIRFRREMGAIYVAYLRARGRNKVIVMMTVSIGVYLPEVTCDFAQIQ